MKPPAKPPIENKTLREGRLLAPGANVEITACVFNSIALNSPDLQAIRIARICAMVPPPWLNMIRFHGVLAPNAKLRELVVASAKPYVPPNENTAPNPLQLLLFEKLFDEPEAEVSHKRRKPWAWLLKHVFAIDVNVCPQCAGRMKWRQVALTADAIRDGLSRAGLSARGPPKRKIAPLGQLSLPFPQMRRA